MMEKKILNKLLSFLNMKVDYMAFYEGSFADEKIINIQYNNQIKKLSFGVKGAQTENSLGTIILYRNLVFEISNWWGLKILSIDPDTQQEKLIEWVDGDFLDEILIYSATKAELILEGFGKSSMKWKKFIFIKAEISLTGDL